MTWPSMTAPSSSSASRASISARVGAMRTIVRKGVRVAELLADAARRVAVRALGVAADSAARCDSTTERISRQSCAGSVPAPGTCASAHALASTHAIASRRVMRVLTTGFPHTAHDEISGTLSSRQLDASAS